MLDNAASLVLGSLIGDALALGAHWVYDQTKIKNTLGRVTGYVAPGLAFYHKGKAAGDVTHYGDQVLVLLESVSARSDFDLEDFFGRWRVLFADYPGYMDGATRDTLKNIAAGKGAGGAGSDSTDLAGASRIAPVVWAMTRQGRDVEALVAAARAQTAMTHGPLVVDAAECLARAAWDVLAGTPPLGALRAAATRNYAAAPMAKWLAAGLDTVAMDTSAAILQLNPSCDIEGAFPGLVHLVAKYQDDFQNGLVENVMAGGDSAARGLALGMLLGGHVGVAGMPQAWISDLVHRDRVMALLGAA